MLCIIYYKLKNKVYSFQINSNNLVVLRNIILPALEHYS